MAESLDAIIISDLHLGSRHCQGRLIEKFVSSLPPSEWLYLNGDIIDCWNLTRLKSSHRQVLAALRRQMLLRKVVWLIGNHENDMDLASDLMGVPFLDHSIMVSGGKSYIIMHGHQLKKMPYDSKISNDFSRMDDRGCVLINRPKHHGPSRVRKAAENLASAAIMYASGKSLHGIVCGHTHYPSVWPAHGMIYANSGAWVGMRGVTTSTWLSAKNGIIRLNNFLP